MKKQALISVAALLASASIALAQEPPNAAGDKAPAANAPSQGASPSPGVKPSGQMERQGGPGAAGSAEGRSTGEAGKGDDTVKKSDDAGMKSDDGSAEGRSSSDDGKADDVKKSGDAGKPGSDNSAEGRSGGEGGKAEKPNLTGEQRTKVQSTFSKHRVEPAKDINISINVGVAVPRSVRLYDVPQDIVVIVPAYRSYRYFIYEDTIVVVDPVTWLIIDVIALA